MRGKWKFIKALRNSLKKEFEGITLDQTEKILLKITKIALKALKEDKIFELPEIGTFKLLKRNARKCRNPQTGEVINLPSQYRMKLHKLSKVSKMLLETVNKEIEE